MATKSKLLTMSDIRTANKTYFKRGQDAFFGITARKLIKSDKLGCQVMIEKSDRGYSVRKIAKDADIGVPEFFKTNGATEAYIGKSLYW